MPAFSRSVGPDDPMIVRTLSEHVELRSKIEHLTGAMENLDNIEASFLQDLGRLLQEHIRFEEDVLFPAMEKALDAEQLARIGEALRR